MLAPFQPLHPRHLPPRPTPSAHSGLPSRPHTTASSGAWESEVTTLTAPPHLRGCPGRGRLPPGQTPPSRLDDRGNHPVPGAQQGAYGSLHSNWPSWTTATMVIPQGPLPASFRPLLEVSVLPSLRRLGRRPHLSRLPLHQTCGGPPLQLSHSSHGSAPGLYVDGTPSGRSIPGRAPTVLQHAPTANRFRLLSFITFILTVGHLLPGHQQNHIILI